MKFQIVICGFLLCPPFSLAQADGGRGYAGTAAANFLKLGVGARTLAMGETGTATADDVNALYWNPANLSSVKQGSLSLMQNAYAESISYQYAAYAHPTPEWGTFGGAFQRLSAGDILQTDETGRELGDFSPRDLAMSFGWGRSLTEPWHVGTSVKFIQSKIINSASTFALDMGAAYRKEKLTVGTSLRNIGGRMKFDQERESIPMTLHTGAAYNLSSRWLLALDAAIPNDAPVFAGFGTEYNRPFNQDSVLFLRAGYNTRTNHVPGFEGIGMGFGLRWTSVDVDYAWAPMGDFGSTHRISMTLRFAARKQASDQTDVMKIREENLATASQPASAAQSDMQLSLPLMETLSVPVTADPSSDSAHEAPSEQTEPGK